MPDTDRLAKLIAHRQEQEKKNDRIRVHKNRVEMDKLKVQVMHLDWSKVLRSRELSNVEEDYVRRLEKIYDRQMYIQEERIEAEEKKQKEKEARKRSLEAIERSYEVAEKDRRRQAHGTKQEFTKSFLNKAKSLSGGYRDNDPPKVYYKRKGLVPPDRMVAPEISAEAQASFGGGARIPSSAAHLYIGKKLPKGTENTDPRSRLTSSRSQSARSSSSRSGRSERLLSALSVSDEDDDNSDLDRDLIDEVIRVNVRPSTAPNRRRMSKSYKEKQPQPQKDEVLVTEQVPRLSIHSESHSVRMEPEIQTIELKESNDTVSKHSRPATAGASVRFAGNPPTGRKSRSPYPSSRRKSSKKPPTAVLFLKRASVPGQNGNRRAASATTRNRRNEPKPIVMSNAEQDRIRRKIQDKAECLYTERMKRLVLICMKEKGEEVPRRIQSATSTREIPFYEHYLKNIDRHSRRMAWNSQQNPEKNTGEIETMLAFIDRCERGLALAEPVQAKNILLQATQETTTRLKENVREFVKSR